VAGRYQECDWQVATGGWQKVVQIVFRFLEVKPFLLKHLIWNHLFIVGPFSENLRDLREKYLYLIEILSTYE